MSSYSINAGDTQPLRVQILDSLGKPSDLSSLASVKIYMMTRAGAHVLGPKDCDFSEGNGIVAYAWLPLETETPGTYAVQFDLRNTEDVFSWPNPDIPGGAFFGLGNSLGDDLAVTEIGTALQMQNILQPPASTNMILTVSACTGHLVAKGLDPYGDMQTFDQDSATGQAFFGPWSRIFSVQFTPESISDPDSAVVSFVADAQGTLVQHGRAPARGYLDLFIQPAVP